MVDVTTETAEELERIAEDNEVEFDTVRSTFKEKFEELDERSSGLPQEKKEALALRSVRTNLLKEDRTPTTDVEMVTIGGEVRNWSKYDDNGNEVGDKEVFVGNAYVDQNPDEEQGKEMLATVIIDEEDDMEIPEVYDAFDQIGNIVRGEFSVSEGSLDGFLVLNSDEDTELDVTVPDDRGEIVEEIRDAVPEFTIENIADNLSAVERADDGNTYATDFGVDIRRIEGDIYDSFKNPEKGTGIYTIRDETVFDTEDVMESDVYDPSDDQGTPGLTIFVDPNKMEYGSESVCEFYGTVTKNDDGIPTMNAVAIEPLLETDFDGYVKRDDDSSPEEEVESNVDRTQI